MKITVFGVDKQPHKIHISVGYTEVHNLEEPHIYELRSPNEDAAYIFSLEEGLYCGYRVRTTFYWILALAESIAESKANIDKK